MLYTYTLDQAHKWDEIVRSFHDYDVYWLSGYVKAFKLHGDGEPLLFYYEDGSTRGINVAMKRDVADDIHFRGKIPKRKYIDFSTPYGYGGWLIEGEETEKLFEVYSKKMEDDNIISEFVRFHPMLANHIFAKELYDITELGCVVHMDLKSPEYIHHQSSQSTSGPRRKLFREEPAA